MPSMRRIKVFGLFIAIVVVTILFCTSSARSQRDPDTRTINDFYAKTKNALNKKPGTAGAEKVLTDDQSVTKKMQQRLKEAAQVAKDNANAKAPKPDPPSSIVGVGSSAEGARDDRGVAKGKKATGDVQKPVKEESKEDHEVEVELNAILKKSPIIIFSKSYCPHSKQAKDILLQKYIIVPAPYVVELDHHPLGLNLQDKLAELTGRRTVPNILINGVSVGGGDDVAGLDTKGSLIDKINDLGGKKMSDVRMRPIEKEEAKVEKGHGL